MLIHEQIAISTDPIAIYARSVVLNFLLLDDIALLCPKNLGHLIYYSPISVPHKL